jgi:type II secretory pathway component PulL
MLDIVLNSEPEEQLDVVKLQNNSNEAALKVTDDKDETFEKVRDELKSLCTVELKK